MTEIYFFFIFKFFINYYSKQHNYIFTWLWKYICVIYSAKKYLLRTLHITGTVLANSLTSRSLISKGEYLK